MNVQHSIGTPVRCEISTTGLMSAMTVRAAQLALTREPLRRNLARQPFDVADHVRPGARQAEVRRVDAEPIDQVKDLDLLLDASDTAPTATAGRRAASRRRACTSRLSDRPCGSSRG